MAGTVEIWLTPTGGMSGEPLLLESRVLAHGERPPVTYEFAGALLIASGPAERRHGANARGRWRVQVFDPDYCAPCDGGTKPAPVVHPQPPANPLH